MLAWCCKAYKTKVASELRLVCLILPVLCEHVLAHRPHPSNFCVGLANKPLQYPSYLSAPLECCSCMSLTSSPSLSLSLKLNLDLESEAEVELESGSEPEAESGSCMLN